ncbi:MAG: HEAT repeat domain-containing protein, partial [Candidatus Omnitrophica bacterium]|nr:HEAT repeat domain-containing protein [Candidatus Omnitrophota bacterium]
MLSLNEDTQTIEPHRINGLLDMGIKPVFKLTTASGRSIKTTANHPYLVKVKGERGKAKGKETRWMKVSELRVGDAIGVPASDYSRISGEVSQRVGYSVINLPSKLPKSSRSLFNDRMRVVGSFCAILSQTTENIFSRPYLLLKSSSFVMTTRFSFLDIKAIVSSAVVLGTIFTSRFFALRNVPSSLRTFSSSKNLGIRIDDDKMLFGEGARVFQRGLDVLGRQRREGFPNPSRIFPAGQHLEDLPDHDTSALKRRLAMANVGIGNDMGINHDFSHCLNLLGEKYSTFLGALTRFAVLPAQAAEPSTVVLWDPILSIEPLGLEHVWDIEVAGTHNFIGNGIFAHNTYIGTPPAIKIFEKRSVPEGSDPRHGAGGQAYGTGGVERGLQNLKPGAIGTISGYDDGHAGRDRHRSSRKSRWQAPQLTFPSTILHFLSIVRKDRDTPDNQHETGYSNHDSPGERKLLEKVTGEPDGHKRFSQVRDRFGDKLHLLFGHWFRLSFHTAKYSTPWNSIQSGPFAAGTRPVTEIFEGRTIGRAKEIAEEKLPNLGEAIRDEIQWRAGGSDPSGTHPATAGGVEIFEGRLKESPDGGRMAKNNSFRQTGQIATAEDLLKFFEETGDFAGALLPLVLWKIDPSVIHAAIPPLIAVLDGENPSVRQNAAWALGQIGPAAHAAIPSLIAVLGDENPFVRENAAWALGQI